LETLRGRRGIVQKMMLQSRRWQTQSEHYAFQYFAYMSRAGHLTFNRIRIFLPAPKGRGDWKLREDVGGLCRNDAAITEMANAE
jgi:hypothetical protein